MIEGIPEWGKDLYDRVEILEGRVEKITDVLEISSDNEKLIILSLAHMVKMVMSGKVEPERLKTLDDLIDQYS